MLSENVPPDRVDAQLLAHGAAHAVGRYHVRRAHPPLLVADAVAHGRGHRVVAGLERDNLGRVPQLGSQRRGAIA